MGIITLTVSADAEDLALAAAALTQAAAQRRRAAERAAADLERTRRESKSDMRTNAMKVIGVLGAAGILEDVAKQLLPPTPADPAPTPAGGAEPGSIDAELAAADAADAELAVTDPDADVVPIDARAKATLESLQQAGPAATGDPPRRRSRGKRTPATTAAAGNDRPDP